MAGETRRGNKQGLVAWEFGGLGGWLLEGLGYSLSAAGVGTVIHCQGRDYPLHLRLKPGPRARAQSPCSLGTWGLPTVRGVLPAAAPGASLVTGCQQPVAAPGQASPRQQWKQEA